MTEEKLIEIPSEIARVVEDHLIELGADSLQELVLTVLTDHLRRLGLLSPYTEEEEAEVERRLRDLGYVD